jgi:hypothetical protein
MLRLRLALLVPAALFAGLIVLAAAKLLAAEDTGDSLPRAQGGQSPIDRVRWHHLSSARGELPVPGTSAQQTGALVADLDGDGINDFVLSFRQVAPALVWYRRVQNGWTRHVLEPDFLTVEAGGAAYDIDGDGDLDLVFGGDWQSSDVWWWENPGRKHAIESRWTRHVVKSGGATQHHDQVFGDFLQTGRAQLAFWNQNAKAIFLATVPADPRHAAPWDAVKIFEGAAGEPEACIPRGWTPQTWMATATSICSPATRGSSARTARRSGRSASRRSVAASPPDSSSTADRRRS